MGKTVNRLKEMSFASWKGIIYRKQTLQSHYRSSSYLHLWIVSKSAIIEGIGKSMLGDY